MSAPAAERGSARLVTRALPDNCESFTAFMLEATFFGVMLLGRERVSPRFFFFACCMVSLGTMLSSFVTIAGCRFHGPQRSTVDGKIITADWWAITTGPSCVGAGRIYCSELFLTGQRGSRLIVNHHGSETCSPMFPERPVLAIPSRCNRYFWSAPSMPSRWFNW